MYKWLDRFCWRARTQLEELKVARIVTVLTPVLTFLAPEFFSAGCSRYCKVRIFGIQVSLKPSRVWSQRHRPYHPNE